MAVASLVSGIVALVTSILPIINNLSFLLAILGIVFAIVGLVGISKGKKSGKGLGVAGLVLSVIAFILVLVMQSEATQAAYGVTIDGCRVTEDYQGNPAVVVTYTFTNNSDEATSFMVALYPKVFQNGVELGTAIGSDWDSEKYSSDVKPGSSTTVEMGYALEDMSDITVEVEELLSFSDAVLAEQTFSLS